MQGAFVDHNCAIGLILGIFLLYYLFFPLYDLKFCTTSILIGTGSNACYIERADRIEKWEGDHKNVKEVIIKHVLILPLIFDRLFELYLLSFYKGGD